LCSATVKNNALPDGTVTVLIVLGVALQGRESDATARTLTFASLVVGLLGLITVNRSWSRNLWQILHSRNTAYCCVMAGASAFLAAVLYVPFLRSVFRFASLSLQELGFAMAAGFATLILLAGIKRFSVQSRKRQRTSSGRS
jgi:Ca2+-transporting ATPase